MSRWWNPTTSHTESTSNSFLSFHVPFLFLSFLCSYLQHIQNAKVHHQRQDEEDEEVLDAGAVRELPQVAAAAAAAGREEVVAAVASGRAGAAAMDHDQGPPAGAKIRGPERPRQADHHDRLSPIGCASHRKPDIAVGFPLYVRQMNVQDLSNICRINQRITR